MTTLTQVMNRVWLGYLL